MLRSPLENRIRRRLLAVWAVQVFAASVFIDSQASASGLVVDANVQNTSFMDASGHRVYLAGAHTWNNLVDMDAAWPARQFDFEAYLVFLEDHHFNLTRLWTWELPAAASDRYPRRQVAGPLPWARTGPGVALDQRPRFDLTKFDPEYFNRLRERVQLAQEKRIYVIVMLFEGWGVQFAPGKFSHPFGRDNNINGIDFGADPKSIHTLDHPAITEIQRAYLEKVVDTVNDFDNVLYEIANEAGPYSTEWQARMIAELNSYQATKTQQHLVGMTFQYPDGSNATLISSQADWIAPGPEEGRMLIDPPSDMGLKPIISDSDHLVGSAGGGAGWVWRSFTRGINLLYMDRYVGPDAVTGEPYSRAHLIRIAMGDTRLIADALHADRLVPRDDLSTTGFALAGPDVILAYQPHHDPFLVNAGSLEGPLMIEWMNTDNGDVTLGEAGPGGRRLLLQSPYAAGSIALIYQGVRPESQTLSGLEDDFVRLRHAAWKYLDLDQYLMERARQALVRQFPMPSYRGLVLMFISGAVSVLIVMVLGTVAFRWSRGNSVPRPRP